MLSDHMMLMIAHAVYEADRAWMTDHGDAGIVAWADTEDATRANILNRIKRVLSDPRFSDATFHNEWVDTMKKAGWSHGKHYDEFAKSDPLMVPFHLLPPVHQAKERLFRSVVLSLSRV